MEATALVEPSGVWGNPKPRRRRQHGGSGPGPSPEPASGVTGVVGAMWSNRGVVFVFSDALIEDGVVANNPYSVNTEALQEMLRASSGVALQQKVWKEQLTNSLAPMVEALTASHAPVLQRVNSAAFAQSLQKAVETTYAPVLEKVNAVALGESLRATAASLESVTRGIDTRGIAAAIKIPTMTLPAPSWTSMSRISDMVKRIDWEAFERRVYVPSNWPVYYEAHLPGLIDLVGQDGIPVAFVPRWEIIKELSAANTFDERSAILLIRRMDIVDDCFDALSRVDTPRLQEFMATARSALGAGRMGWWDLMTTTAVTVAHNVVEAVRWPDNRPSLVKHHRLTPATALTDLIQRATTAPLVSFYTDWNEKSGEPYPTRLSRHALTHKFRQGQVSERNAIVSIMLMTSLLTGVDDLGLLEGGPLA